MSNLSDKLNKSLGNVSNAITSYAESEAGKKSKRGTKVFFYTLAGFLSAAVVVVGVISIFPAATKGLAVISFAVALRYYKDIHVLTIELWRHWKSDEEFDFSTQFPTLVLPLTFILFAAVLVNPRSMDSDSLLSTLTGRFDRVEEILVDRKAVSRGRGVSNSEPVRYVFFNRPPENQATARAFADAVFPLRFENAQLAPDYPPENDFDIDKVKWLQKGDNGVRVREDHKADLRDLLSILAPCTTEPVSLHITGYASSLPFDEYGSQDISDSLNVLAANTRAENVRIQIGKMAEKIEKEDSENRFSPDNLNVEIHKHDDIDEMKSHMIFNDRPGGTDEENESEGLTRAAFIRIEDVGACKAENYERAVASNTEATQD